MSETRSPLKTESLQRAIRVCEDLVVSQTPNFFRLHMNREIAGACVALSGLSMQLAGGRRFSSPASVGDITWPVFLANGNDEALSGALKLARFTFNSREETAVPASAVILDPEDQYADWNFPEVREKSGHRGLLPQVLRCREATEIPATDILILSSDAVRRAGTPEGPSPALLQAAKSASLRIYCADSDLLFSEACAGFDANGLPAGHIVQFDHSLTGGSVPFGGFAAPAEMMQSWISGKRTNFHSTTFQPNAVSARALLMFLRESELPRAKATVDLVRSVVNDDRRAADVYSRLLSSSMCRLSRVTGFHSSRVRASGAWITNGRKRVYDLVGGVACSVRGHNPPGFCEDLDSGDSEVDVRTELRERLRNCSGLADSLPATSGAQAVGLALRCAFTATEAHKTHVVCLKGGFSGKTLLPLAGTSRDWYHEHVGPLLPNVHRIDPFSSQASLQLRDICLRFPVGIIQLELIQGVGGVRAVPEELLETISELRKQNRILVLVDEIQTGFFRTGPFLRCQDTVIQPDIVTIGKGTSDMMCPSARVLLGEETVDRIDSRRPELRDRLQNRYTSELADRTLRNALRYAAANDIEAQVRSGGRHFLEVLTQSLSPLANVREVRSYGYLTGIELRRPDGLLRFAGKLPARAVLLGFLMHARFPLLAGFCQYDPWTLKITPPLNAEREHLEEAVAAMRDVLRGGYTRPTLKLIAQTATRLASPVRTLKAESHESKGSSDESLPN